MVRFPKRTCLIYPFIIPIPSRIAAEQASAERMPGFISSRLLIFRISSFKADIIKLSLHWAKCPFAINAPDFFLGICIIIKAIADYSDLFEAEHIQVKDIAL